jgi:hypothetical protein
MKAHAPSTEVIGVFCAEGAPAMALSLQDGVMRTTEERRDRLWDG